MPETLDLDLLYDEAFPDEPFLSGRLRAEMERMGYGNAEAIRGERLAARLAEAEALLREIRDNGDRYIDWVDYEKIDAYFAAGDPDA